MHSKLTPTYLLILIPFLLLVSCKHSRKAPSIDLIGHDVPDIPNQEARALFQSGLNDIEKRDYGAARESFSEANKICPNNPEILNGIGATFSQTGNPTRGIEYFERALKIDSNFFHAYANLGASLNQMGQFAEAKRIFNLGLARPKANRFYRSEILFNLANSYYQEEDYDSSLVFLDSAKRTSGPGKMYDMVIRAENDIHSKMPLPIKR